MNNSFIDKNNFDADINSFFLSLTEDEQEYLLLEIILNSKPGDEAYDQIVKLFKGKKND